MLLFWTRLDNKLIAFDLGFRRDSSFLAYMTSFEPDLAKFRPGHVNLASAFALSESLGLTIFDFSKGEDEAKKQWSDGVAGSSIWAFAARTDAISRWTVFWLGARVRTLNWIRESKWFYKARALRPNLGFLTARNKDSSSLAGTAQLLIGWPLREFEQLAQLAEYI